MDRGERSVLSLAANHDQDNTQNLPVLGMTKCCDREGPPVTLSARSRLQRLRQRLHRVRRCSGHRRLRPVRRRTPSQDRSLTSHAEIARPFRAKLRRTFATVQDPPVRRYGGLKDQDRIFTNAYSRHDHGIKGALVSHDSHLDVSHRLTGRVVQRRLAPDKGYSLEGRQLDYSDHQGLRPAWPWWCRLPKWSEVEFYEQARLGEGPPTPVPCREC